MFDFYKVRLAESIQESQHDCTHFLLCAKNMQKLREAHQQLTMLNLGFMTASEKHPVFATVSNARALALFE